jgi:hypothetical protein
MVIVDLEPIRYKIERYGFRVSDSKTEEARLRNRIKVEGMIRLLESSGIKVMIDEQGKVKLSLPR